MYSQNSCNLPNESSPGLNWKVKKKCKHVNRIRTHSVSRSVNRFLVVILLPSMTTSCRFKCLPTFRGSFNNNDCLIGKLFKVKKNGVFRFGISFFVLEIFTFMYYVIEESDDVICSCAVYCIIAVIAVISGLTHKRGERVNSALCYKGII